jgi:outer membrane immunogenic protein
MVRKLWGGAGLFAALVAGGSVAGAADLAVKAPVYKAPPVVVSDWSGFYIGVNGGYGWGDTGSDDTKLTGLKHKVDDGCSFESLVANSFTGGRTVTDHLTTSLGGKPQGGLFGGHAGYNWQYGSVVAGVELDFDGADIKDSGVLGTSGISTFERTIKFDELATARARLGYVVLPSLLAYGTAGAGWGHSELTWSASGAGTTISHSFDTNNFGWVAGAGLEYKVWEHVLVRAEYLHYDFGKVTYTDGITASSTIDVVRGGLSYKF